MPAFRSRALRISAAAIPLLLLLAFDSLGQTKPNSRPDRADQPAQPSKRNGRPETAAPPSPKPLAKPTHFYEFDRPGFTYSKITIKHDDAGIGTITFLKHGFDESITERIALSTVTLGKIGEALTTLRFLDSTEEYQFVRDYSHLGNSTFTLTRDGRSRTVKYNWTENPAAKVLLDEYRRIGNEYTWAFEMTVARQNMPLQTPGLMDAIESYLQRSEISDPRQLVPFLTELSTDERLPLMARNKASKLLNSIGKSKK